MNQENPRILQQDYWVNHNTFVNACFLKLPNDRAIILQIVSTIDIFRREIYHQIQLFLEQNNLGHIYFEQLLINLSLAITQQFINFVEVDRYLKCESPNIGNISWQ